MSTYEQVIEFAARQLDQRGLLLDRQIAQLAHGDGELLQLVRQRLTAAGVAEDRFGMGLARVGRPGVCIAALNDGRLVDSPNDDVHFSSTDSDDAADSPATAEWWLMSDGDVRGPWTIPQLITMCRRKDLSMSDLVRRGTRGMWLKPGDVVELADVAPEFETQPIMPAAETHAYVTANQPSSKVDRDISVGAAVVTTALEPTDGGGVNEVTADDSPPGGKSTNLPTIGAAEGRIPPVQRPPVVAVGSGISRPTRSMRSSGDQLGFKAVLEALSGIPSLLIAALRRFIASTAGTLFVTAVALVIALQGILWLWPPSSATIIKEFDVVHARVKDLKLSRKPDEQLKVDLAADRTRIERLVAILQGRASEAPSVHRELLMAGKHGLLVMLDHPRNSDRFERLYVLHIEQAKRLLEGRPITEAPVTPPTGPTPAIPSPASRPLESSAAIK